jgi:acetolactate synthase I/II/III large subunit
MTRRMDNGADLLCRTLESMGIVHVFGVPGTQNVLLYEAIQRSKLRSVLSTHELAASFMANGYYRASGRVAPLITIPGPGFTYALTGVAEASHDSVALLHIVGKPPAHEGKSYEFQSIDQEAIAASLVKGVRTVDRVDDVPRKTLEAYGLAVAGEPGPVLMQWTVDSLAHFPTRPVDLPLAAPLERQLPKGSLVDEVAARLGAAQKPILLVGQGAAASAEMLQQLAECTRSPVFTTISGRGILPEDHELALGFDLARSEVGILNEMIRRSDCVIAFGCKLSSAETGGYLLELPKDRLIRVEAGEEVLQANYPAGIAIRASTGTVLDRLLPAVKGRRKPIGGGWTREEIGDYKRRLRQVPEKAVPEPVVHGVTPSTAGSFVGALRRILPRNGIVVTDSGLHQSLVRRHFDVLAPRGLIVPSGFQSMGFGLPAAIGAKLAAPDRPVIAIIGDGCFAMTGMELLTAVREKIPLTVVVFNDGRLNLIRLQQFASSGRSESVNILNPDFGAFAAAVGAQYAFIDGNAEQVLQSAVASEHVTLVEVAVGDSQAIHLMRGKGIVRETVRRTLGPGIVRRIKSWKKRR